MTTWVCRRVLLVGETTSHGLTGSYARACHELGLESRVFDYYRALEPATSLRTAMRVRPVQLAWEGVARIPAEVRLVECARGFRPDVVLFVKCDDLHSAVYPILRRLLPNCRLTAFHPDDPFRTYRLWRRGPAHRRANAQLRAVDHYFLWSRRLVDQAAASGVRACSYLAFAADPTLHRPIVPTSVDRSTHGSDVAFIGNWDERRERWLAAFDGAGLDLAIWGSDYWARRCANPFLRSRWRGRAVVGDEFSRVVATTSACVNVLRDQNADAHNMRTFEVPASAGVLLAEWSEDQASHFAPDSEAVYATTPEDLVQKAAALVRSPDHVARIRTAALRRALGATYGHRLRQLLGALGDLRA